MSVFFYGAYGDTKEEAINLTTDVNVKAEVEKVGVRLRELYNATDDWLHALRTAYGEYKETMKNTWLRNLKDDPEALREAAYDIYSKQCEWDGCDYVPISERTASQYDKLQQDVIDLSYNPWDNNAKNYYPDYQSGKVGLYVDAPSSQRSQ